MVRRFSTEYIKAMTDWFQKRTELDGIQPTIAETKEIFDMSEDSVRKYIKEAGLEFRKRGTAPGRPRGPYKNRKTRHCPCGADITHLDSQGKYCSVNCPSRPMRWTPPNKDVVPDLLERYKTEKHLETLASELGITVHQARRHLMQEGVWEGRQSKNKSSLFEEHGDRAKELFESGMSPEWVASVIGVSKSSVVVWSRDEGWVQKEKISRRPTGIGSMSSTTYEEVEHLLPGLWEKSKVSHESRKGFTSGSSYRVAEELGVDPKVAQEWLERSGVDIRKPKYEGLIGEMVDFYKDHSLSVTAQKFGVTPGTASRWLRDAGVTIIEDRTKSSYEKEIVALVESWGFDVVHGDRSIIGPREIDVFIPSRNFGIEFNGSYTHSEARQPDKWYHLKKTQDSAEKGVRLMHIFEHWWLEKRDLYISQIRNNLGISERKINARDCTVREIPWRESSEFLNKNHFQGSTKRVSVSLGLFLGDELVSVMTLGKPMSHKRKEDFELVRLCSITNSSVRGGASKMFSFFKKMHPSASVVSYSDIGRTTGGVYEAMGFSFEKITDEPNYVWYKKNGKALTRYQTQVAKLKVDPELQGKYGEDLQSMSESDIMQAEGYVRVYDAGSKVWVYKP